MSGICGYAGRGDPALLDVMLAAIDYRGDHTDVAHGPGMGLGYRCWAGRPGQSPDIHRDGPHRAACAGTFAPPVPSPAAALRGRLDSRGQGLEDLDGAFAGASWDGERRCLSLLRDPFGVRSLYYVEHAGVLYFASELKQLLAIPGLAVAVDPVALHRYLTFSFVTGEETPVRGIRRLLPGTLLTWEDGRLVGTPYFTLKEQIGPEFHDPRPTVRAFRRRCRQAIARRLTDEGEVGLFLSGGLDSSGVAAWLRQAGVKVSAFSLDFGPHNVEKEQAERVARLLEIPLTLVKAGGEDLVPVLLDLVWKLDLPFGDPVTGPQYLLGRAARQAGLTTVFNGEGGDQLFGGWTSKPMISAQLYAGLYGEDSREELYLQSYHRFHGLEGQLYTAEFGAQVDGLGGRRAQLRPYLRSENAATFLNRVRLADIGLKGSENILPRMEQMAGAWGLDVRVPFFDRELAEDSFRLPPQMKLHGACEKYILKLILQEHLPRDIVRRPKSGMGVPITDWVLGPLAELVGDLLGPQALARRGLFRGAFVARMRRGQDEPNETRRRRVGERLWTLAMIEAWLRVFIDGRGKRPGGAA